VKEELFSEEEDSDNAKEDRHLDKKRKSEKNSKKDKKKSSSDDSGDNDSDLEEEKPKGGNSKEKSRASIHRKALLPERYDGTTSLTIFLTQLESCAKYNEWSTEDKATHLRVNLKENASYIIDDKTFEDATFDQ